MSNVSGLTTLDAFVRKLLVKKKKGNEMYLRYLTMAADAMQKLNFGYLGSVKTVELDVNTDTNTVDYPDDYIDYVSLSIDDGDGKMWTYTKDGNILFYTEPVPAPVAITATNITQTGFSANWNAADNATGYYLYVSTNASFLPYVTGYDGLSVGNVTTYAIDGLDPETTYYYKVRGFNSEEISDLSNVISAEIIQYDLVDLDGNIYTTVIIGSQEWIIENWRCTKYADGTDILNLQESGYDDWFLPSIDELEAMYDNLHLEGVGDFISDSYWSSTESSDYAAFVFPFNAGPEYTAPKPITFKVRACRSFTDSIGAYSLRDIGPAGGLIFYIDDIGGGDAVFYEAAPSDQSTGIAWSNITNALIGSTGTAIGTGKQNTLDIIAQAGHTDSAAKLCDDLSVGGWINDTTGAYCAYDNDEDNIPVYGLLYNWYAATNEKGLIYLERDGVQENGWRIPSDTDLEVLRTYLGGMAVAGGKLKETGVIYWNSPNTGATNETGFSSRGSGYRYYNGNFYSIKNNNPIWSSDEEDVANAHSYGTQYNSAGMAIGAYEKIRGFSVRSVRDV